MSFPSPRRSTRSPARWGGRVREGTDAGRVSVPVSASAAVAGGGARTGGPSSTRTVVSKRGSAEPGSPAADRTGAVALGAVAHEAKRASPARGADRKRKCGRYFPSTAFTIFCVT